MVRDPIVRCFHCGSYVRKSATAQELVGAREEEETWCLDCIQVVDDATKAIKDENRDQEFNQIIEKYDTMEDTLDD